MDEDVEIAKKNFLSSIQTVREKILAVKSESPSLKSIIEFLNQFSNLIKSSPYKDVYNRCNIQSFNSFSNWIIDISDLCINSISLFSSIEAQVDIIYSIWNLVNVTYESISSMSMIHDLMSYEEDYLLVQRSVVSTIAKYTEKQMDLKTINDREYKEKFESIAKRGQDIIDIISSIKDIQVKELKK